MEEKKKILFIYYQNIKAGGVARVLSNLANELCASDFDVTILFLMDGEHQFYHLNHGIKILSLNSFNHWFFRKGSPFLDKFLKNHPKKMNLKSYLFDFGQWNLLNKWLKKNHHNYDEIISCWYKISSQIARNKTIAKKTIAWEHISYDVGGFLWRKFKPKYKNLRNVICTNSADLNNYLLLNQNTKRISNMMSIETENQLLIESKTKKNIINIICRLDPEKNVKDFIDIINQLKIDNSWSINIIGNGEQKCFLENYVKELNINNISFLGQVNAEKLNHILVESKIICLTSLKEALPTILIEALFFSNTIIAYDCPSGPSDIINENNGFLIPMHDKELFREKLQLLIDNPNILDNLCISSYDSSKNWRKEKIINQWKEILSH